MIWVHVMTIKRLKGQRTSYEVIKTYFPISLDANELEHSRWSRFACLAEMEVTCSPIYFSNDIVESPRDIETKLCTHIPE